MFQLLAGIRTAQPRDGLRVSQGNPAVYTGMGEQGRYSLLVQGNAKFLLETSLAVAEELFPQEGELEESSLSAAAVPGPGGPAETVAKLTPVLRPSPDPRAGLIAQPDPSKGRYDGRIP